MIYFIYYHSAEPEQDNSKIVETIKSYPGWAILGPNFFLVRRDDVKDDGTDTNLLAIRQKLREVGSAADEFFVGQMGDEAVWQGYGAPLKQWLIKNSLKKEEREDESFKSRSATTQTKSLVERIEEARKKAEASAGAKEQ